MALVFNAGYLEDNQKVDAKTISKAPSKTRRLSGGVREWEILDLYIVVFRQ